MMIYFFITGQSNNGLISISIEDKKILWLFKFNEPMLEHIKQIYNEDNLIQ